MDSFKIDKVNITASSGIITTEASMAGGDTPGTEFAFYIFRNNERIHTEWYKLSNKFIYDTLGKPGCYHIQVFAKNSDKLSQGNSSSIFLNPLEITTESFASADQSAVAYSLKGNNWTIPALYYPSENNALYVLLPAAVNRKKSSIPAFNRWTWAKEGMFPGSTLCISDPTLELHSDLEIGWCLGDKDNCVTTELAEFVKRIAEVKGVPFENIVFYGSSAGGFAALALSAKLEGSTAVAINPQVDAMAYSVVGQVDLVAQTCFGMTKENVKERFKNRVDMKSAWSGNSKSKAFFVQNLEDGHHYKIHFKPMWDSLGGEEPNDGINRLGHHTAWIYRQEGGHIPETKEMAKEIIDILANSY